MRETGKAGYKTQLMNTIKRRFGRHTVRFGHNDPNLPGQQGIPDLTVYIDDKWFLLEVKASEKSKERPNQGWWIEEWSKVTFCSFVFPENEQEVLNAMERSLADRG
jgi:hypothetical protein